MAESLATRHARLQRQTDELFKDHKRLQAEPGNESAHVEHRARLQRHIRELREHLERLQSGK